MTQSGERVVCPAKKDLAVRWFIAGAMFIGFGLWCAYDGYVTKAITKDETHTPNGQIDLNKFLKYYLNTVGGVVLPLGGLFPVVMGLRAMRRKIVADDSGIGEEGKQIPWSQITKLDDSQLAEKAVLKLHYEQDGQTKQLVLNQMDLENFKSLVGIVQAKVVAK